MSYTDLDLELIRKYNVRGPRYTSYPTAVQFSEADSRSRAELWDYVDGRNREPRNLSLYFHIPFCFSLCWYCGCTKKITRDQSRSAVYLEYLGREMDRIAQRVHPESRVIQVHLGGGTPTFMKPEELKMLSGMVKEKFHVSGDSEWSIEMDPRRIVEDLVEAIADAGFNRASLGVQDTNPEVQEAIHRIQPFELVGQVVEWLRKYDFESVNFDLIYGLPRQSPNTFEQTLKDVITLDPDRFAVYSFAHLPDMFPAQKLLNVDELPTGDEKLEMLMHAIRYLSETGYRYIGMDHFSKEGDELTVAMDEGSLQRNFQGYSTLSGADLYAFGMSGISNVGNRYWQNTKEIEQYYRKLKEEEPPVFKTLTLDRDDRIRRDVIMRIMCRSELRYAEVEDRWDISFETYFGRELESLAELEEDGLIAREDKGFNISNRGRLFLRNIAMCFDKYLIQKKAGQNFSKTV